MSTGRNKSSFFAFGKLSGNWKNSSRRIWRMRSEAGSSFHAVSKNRMRLSHAGAYTVLTRAIIVSLPDVSYNRISILLRFDRSIESRLSCSSVISALPPSFVTISAFCQACIKSIKSFLRFISIEGTSESGMAMNNCATGSIADDVKVTIEHKQNNRFLSFITIV